MSVLKYHDYQGLVRFEDDHLVVSILHIDDIISTTFTNAEKAQDVFRDLVDDYIETCASLGREPDKSFKGSFNVRVSPDLHRRAAMTAAEEGKSLNSWTAQAMEDRLGRAKERLRPMRQRASD
jgi:predicted HicB family RNase H-like nuclease